jgi:hypothetical protein
MNIKKCEKIEIVILVILYTYLHIFSLYSHVHAEDIFNTSRNILGSWQAIVELDIYLFLELYTQRNGTNQMRFLSDSIPNL